MKGDLEFCRVLSRVRRSLSASPRARLALSGLLIGLITLASLYLWLGPRPSEEGIAAAKAAGRKLKAHHYSITTIWWSALGILVACVILLPLAGWFTAPFGSRFRQQPFFPDRTVSRRWIALSAAGATLFAACYTSPRLGYSLWFDEEFMLRKQILADYLRRDEYLRPELFAEVKRRDTQWRELFWFYEMPNNHPPVAAMAWLTQKVAARDLTPDRPQGYYFNETAYRLPSWTAGMLSLGALSLMLGVIGFGRAALIAPWLLAFHPWFLRYASEARGYALLFLFGPLCVITLLLALRSGRWRWWIGFGICEFLFLYSNASGIYLLVLLNLGALFLFLTSREREAADRLVLERRWFLANTFAALAFLTLMGPCLLQLHDHFSPNSRIREIMGPSLMADMISSLATGMRWHPWGEPDHPFALVLSRADDARPLVAVPLLVSLALLLLTGAIATWKKGGIDRWIALAFLFSMPCFYASSYLKGLQLYPWYIVYALPLLWSLVAIGMDSGSRWLAPRTRLSANAAFTSIGLVFLTGFAVLTHPSRLHVRDNPVEKARESVELTRTVVNPFAEGFDEVITVGFNKYTRAYDPGFYQARSYEDFLTLLELAEETGKPLYVNYAMPGLARGAFPRIMATVDDEKVFERTATLYGLEPTTTRFVRRYIPGSLRTIAASSAPSSPK